MSRRRVFFALWPGHASDHLAALANDLVDGQDARLIPPQNLHLTLAFIGAVSTPQIKQLEDIAAGIEGDVFDVRLDRLGFWPQRGILWAGCRQSSAGLRHLMNAMRNNLSAAGFIAADEPRSSTVPHVTLARGARCSSLPRLGTPIGWPVREFSLVESHRTARGSRYEVIAQFPLGTAD